MKHFIILLATLSLFALGGCKTVGAQLKTKNVSIGVNTQSGSGRSAKGPPHCPPGHAKKGQC
ncbi:MAG: hypothetical protein ACOY41_07785 [Pseudomonadota bacterium]